MGECAPPVKSEARRMVAEWQHEDHPSNESNSPRRPTRARASVKVRATRVRRERGDVILSSIPVHASAPPSQQRVL